VAEEGHPPAPERLAQVRLGEQAVDSDQIVPASADRLNAGCAGRRVYHPPMRRSDFRYDLPPQLIAQRPLPERGASRLLALNGLDGRPRDLRFADLPGLLRPGDLLVFNNTRVMRARLCGHKDSGGRAEVLIERLLSPVEALAQVRASKSPKTGRLIYLTDGERLHVLGREGDLYRLQALDAPFRSLMEDQGLLPLPPYIQRPDDGADAERYQTVYGTREGAVAAPTAGLHFDRVMLERLEGLGIDRAEVTLHVGAGTFQPVREEDLDRHLMHAEWLEVSAALCARVEAARARGGRVVAVGTTSVRSLESAAADGSLRPFQGDSRLFIRPGYRFRVVDVLITNFHLPESTLLMLVCAFPPTLRPRLVHLHLSAGRAPRRRGPALIDPVLERAEQYVGLIDQLGLRLVLAVDTHVHADHVTALGALRERTDCATAMGEMSQAECVSVKFREGEKLRADGLALDVLYTPGHTDDSYSFRMADRVFTGDTLLIRGTGRTDFQNGDAGAQYDSLFGKLLTLTEDTLVYPAHDYNGMTVSTIGEERRWNPRLQVPSRQAYMDLMNGLVLDNPRLMDVAVPANRACGPLHAQPQPETPALLLVRGHQRVHRPGLGVLHLTPQTISGQLRELEEQIGAKLFAKAGRNLALTDTGRLVFSYADEMFRLESELRDVLGGRSTGRC
jgi:S-adenosylmethionine:tRNA ribosyltransferase-isomerase